MLATMSDITRNAPFGTDDTPKLRVKIVGGKRVQVAIDKELDNASPKNLNQSWPLPRLGPHGTPSILTQPDWEAYDSRIQSGFNTSDQHNLARKVSSYTSPMGDRSHSFKHGLPTLNTKAVLPPIATQSAGPYIHSNHLMSELNSNSGESEQKTTLEEQVRKQLKKFSSQKLKNMYIDLTTYDRKLTGLVTESQFSLVALRHDLPLSLSILKIIYAHFVDFKDTSMTNYEKILQFFSDCLNKSSSIESPIILNNSGNDRSRTSLSEFHEDRNNNLISTSVPRGNGGLQKSSNVKGPSEGHVSQLRHEAEEKLVELILAQLSPNQNLEIHDLKKSLQELDRLETGILPIHVIKSTCVRHQLPLTSSIILKLLQRSETSGGMADWKLFLEPLERVYQMRGGLAKLNAMADPILASGANKISTTIPSWEREPLGQIGNVATENNHRVSASSLPTSLPSTSSSMDREIPQLPDGWDEHQPTERSDDNMYVSPRRTEPWYHKFNKLSHALRTYHPLNAEVLKQDDAERMTKNYNLIYGLGFSEKKIENAVQQSVLPGKNGSQGNKISVNALLELLEGKKRLLA